MYRRERDICDAPTTPPTIAYLPFESPVRLVKCHRHPHTRGNDVRYLTHFVQTKRSSHNGCNRLVALGLLQNSVCDNAPLLLFDSLPYERGFPVFIGMADEVIRLLRERCETFDEHGSHPSVNFPFGDEFRLCQKRHIERHPPGGAIFCFWFLFGCKGAFRRSPNTFLGRRGGFVEPCSRIIEMQALRSYAPCVACNACKNWIMLFAARIVASAAVPLRCTESVI